MRFANIRGRLQLAVGGGYADVETASDSRFPADPMQAILHWDALMEWAAGSGPSLGGVPAGGELEAPPPTPRQVFGIALNYQAHVGESSFTAPKEPSVFTKFPSCIAAPNATIPIVGKAVDWEVELVVAIGRTARRVADGKAWDHVAGLMVGQDVSERDVQMRDPAPQFSLGKSFPRFGPCGPELVTPDELPNRDDLEIGCSVNGAQMQKARTSELIFSVTELVTRLSHIVTLFPGDLIFTGTPAGVGHAPKPPRHPVPRDGRTSTLEGPGTIRDRGVAGDWGSDDRAPL